MKSVIKISALVAVILTVNVLHSWDWAQTGNVASSPEAVPSKQLMGKMLSHMVALEPFSVSDEKFTNKKNFEEIDLHLKKITWLAKQAAHDPQLQVPGYRISQEVLQGHVAETEKVFRAGNKQYARWMFNSTLS